MFAEVVSRIQGEFIPPVGKWQSWFTKWPPLACRLGFPSSSAGKESPCNAGDPNSIPGSGSSPGERIGYPLLPAEFHGLRSLVGYRHGASKSQTRLWLNTAQNSMSFLSSLSLLSLLPTHFFLVLISGYDFSLGIILPCFSEEFPSSLSLNDSPR